MCVHKPNSSREFAFFDYVRVAVVSARINAPSLAPYVLYMHSEGEAFGNDTLTSWLHQMGVHVINWRLSFLQSMPWRKQRMERSTGICKMDIPLAAKMSSADIASRGLDQQRILMTDADIIFAGEFTYSQRARKLHTFAAGTEVFSDSLNSGVVYFNLTTMLAERQRMLEYAVARRFRFLVADQSWLQEWFDRRLLGSFGVRGPRAKRSGWLKLNEALFNARPFIHPWRGHPMRHVPLPWVEPRIWHWHGYKPRDVACWLESIEHGTWPLRAWREAPGCAQGKGSCKYQPIKDSGCRFLGRIRQTRCYLRTYTYLLAQHQQLLHLAGSRHATRTHDTLAHGGYSV